LSYFDEKLIAISQKAIGWKGNVAIWNIELNWFFLREEDFWTEKSQIWCWIPKVG